MSMFLYNVYDNGELILENANVGEIKKHIGITNLQYISKYADSGYLYRGRYTFEIVKTDDNGDAYASKFEVDWNEAVKPFKRVKWVKSGGRKLIGVRI